MDAEGWDVPGDERRVEVEVVVELEQIAYIIFWEAVPACIHDKVVKGDRYPERFCENGGSRLGLAKNMTDPLQA